MNFIVGIILIILGLASITSSDDKKPDPHKKKLLDSFTDELNELERQEQALRQEVEAK